VIILITLITMITIITKTQEKNMYIIMLFSDRIRFLWLTYIATCYIDIASNTGLFLLLYCSLL